MLELLKRRDVQVLLKAGHKRTEVSRLTGISRSSIQRISAEATTEQFDDTAERLKRRIGRPSIVKGFRETISDILEKQPDLPSSHILRQVQNSGYSGGKTVLYAVVASLRRINSISMQNEAFEWMRAVQQTAIPRSILEKHLGKSMELRKLLKGMRNGPSPQRKKAMAVLFLERGIKCSLVRSFPISLAGQCATTGNEISVWIHDSALREEDECAEEVSRRSNQTSSLFTAPLTALSTRNQSNNLENERSAKNPTRTRAFDLR